MVLKHCRIGCKTSWAHGTGGYRLCTNKLLTTKRHILLNIIGPYGENDGKSQYVCVECTRKLEELYKCSRKLVQLATEKKQLEGYFEAFQRKREHGGSHPLKSPTGKGPDRKVPRRHHAWNSPSKLYRSWLWGKNSGVWFRTSQTRDLLCFLVISAARICFTI